MACESLKENEEHSLGDACTIGIGPGDTSLGKDAVSVSEDWAAGWDSLEELDAEELEGDNTILDLVIAFRLKGKIPDFANPALIFGIEKACSKGCFTTRAKSLFDTIKFFLAKRTARTALEK